MSNKNLINLGKNIQAARTKAGLRQSDVASKAGITTNYYAQIERGEVNSSFDKLESIAKVLKVSLKSLIPN